MMTTTKTTELGQATPPVQDLDDNTNSRPRRRLLSRRNMKVVELSSDQELPECESEYLGGFFVEDDVFDCALMNDYHGLPCACYL